MREQPALVDELYEGEAGLTGDRDTVRDIDRDINRDTMGDRDRDIVRGRDRYSEKQRQI